jgi:hypothetical protein
VGGTSFVVEGGSSLDGALLVAEVSFLTGAAGLVFGEPVFSPAPFSGSETSRRSN